MPERITVIIVGGPPLWEPMYAGAPESACLALAQAIRQDGDLDTMLVTPRSHQAAPSHSPGPASTPPLGTGIRPMPELPHWMWVRGVASAVLSTPTATGWIITGASDTDPPQQTALWIREVATALQLAPVVHAGGERLDMPNCIGFSSEFYSELIQMERPRDLQRLINRYPGWRLPRGGHRPTRDR